MNIRHLKIIAIILCFTFPYSIAAQFGGRGQGQDGGVFAVASPAKSGRFITVGGRLTPARKIGHSIAVSGYVQSILVNLGDPVEPGQPLIQITRDVVGETFLPVVIESRIRGIVSEINVFEKQEVNAGTQAITILDNSRFLLKTNLSDRDARAIGSLGSVQVTGVTPEGDKFQGRIQQISQEPDFITGLFTLTMEFPRSQNLFLGMVLFVDLAASKEEGITIEKTAVFKSDGKSYVWLLNKDNQLTRREIITGAEAELKVTIENGLSSGERFVRQISGNEREGMAPRELIQANMSDNPHEGND
ncbi:MAG: HlyD family efflux transporter periplasmic adaptor subunit [Spirochaetaceae bacterium]|nr:HlyD family efflux transporter periplasmic adaptor subunit [Spirochaetaceae bacterium]